MKNYVNQNKKCLSLSMLNVTVEVLMKAVCQEIQLVWARKQPLQNPWHFVVELFQLLKVKNKILLKKTR